MQNAWGMTREEARSAYRLGGWIEVVNDDRLPRKGQIVEVHKKTCLVRLQGSSIPYDVKLTSMRPQRLIAIEIGKIHPKDEPSMPPDFAPRPSNNGTSKMPQGMEQMLSFFSQIKEAKDGLAGSAAAFNKAHADVRELENMLSVAKMALKAAECEREKCENAIKGIPQNILDMIK